MPQPPFDPGLTQQYTGSLRRTINKDGTFNVSRRGSKWREAHVYLTLINMGWTPVSCPRDRRLRRDEHDLCDRLRVARRGESAER